MKKRAFPLGEKHALKSNTTCSFALCAMHCCEALAAIHRAIFARNKRNLSGLAAVSADGIMHLTRCTSGRPAGFACSAACFAAGGFILETLLCVEFLLTSGEHELSATIFANQRLVFVHGKETPKKMI